MRYLAIPLSLLVIFAILSLSGTVGRLFGLGDQSGAWAILAFGIVLALANAFLMYRAGKTPLLKWGGAIGSLILVGLIGTLSARSAYLSTPAYIIESISVKAVGLDVEGKSGHFETRAELKMLKPDVYDIFWGGLGATGQIKNVNLSRLSGDFDLTKTEQAGEWQLHLHFSKPPKRGELVAFAFGFDIFGSEPENKTYVVHRVSWPTHSLGITIEVLKERPCKTAEAYSGDDLIIDAETRTEAPPMVSGDGSQLHWFTTDAQEGRRYIVICHQ